MKKKLLSLTPTRYFCLGEWHNWGKDKGYHPLSSYTKDNPITFYFYDKKGEKHSFRFYFGMTCLHFWLDGIIYMVTISSIQESDELAVAMFEYIDHGKRCNCGFGFNIGDYQKIIGYTNENNDVLSQGRHHLYDPYD